MKTALLLIKKLDIVQSLFTKSSILHNQIHHIFFEKRILFGQKLPLKKYMYHQSAVYEKFSNPNREKPSAASEVGRNLEWLASYVSNFGDFTQESLPYWPYASAIMENLNLDLISLNQKLKSLARTN